LSKKIVRDWWVAVIKPKNRNVVKEEIYFQIAYKLATYLTERNETSKDLSIRLKIDEKLIKDILAGDKKTSKVLLNKIEKKINYKIQE
jgi:DNA-binding CsgD family transcriptional regulator